MEDRLDFVPLLDKGNLKALNRLSSPYITLAAAFQEKAGKLPYEVGITPGKKIPRTTPPRQDYPAFHRNDVGFAGCIAQIEQQGVFNVLAQNRHDRKDPTVALVVGDAALLSMAPELLQCCGAVIVADNNPDVFRWIALTRQALLDAKSPNEYLRRAYGKDSALYRQLAAKVGRPDVFLSVEKGSLAKYHFLYSDPNEKDKRKKYKRFYECKQAVRQLPIIPFLADLSQVKNWQELNTLLSEHKAMISYLDFTNIWPYIRPQNPDDLTILENELTILPIDVSGIILYATHVPEEFGYLQQTVLAGNIKEYTSQAERDLAQLEANQ